MERTHVMPNDFDWALYEDGYNGCNLKQNKRIKTKDRKTKVFCHEPYAQELYNLYENACESYGPDFTTEIRANALVKVDDMTIINDNELLISVNHGSNSIVVDLTKDMFYKNLFKNGDGSEVTKEQFVANMKKPEFKNSLLGYDIVAKVNQHKNKASLWDGFVEKVRNEMRESFKNKENVAYTAHIDFANGGGYMVTISGCVHAFMPGSMAAINRVTDFDSLIGKDLEVMIEKYDPNKGFIVSHKKYLTAMIPMRLQLLKKELEKDPNKMFTGTITGSTPYGVFVELDEILTGMIYRTLLSDELYEKFVNRESIAGSKVDVYVHSIDNNRIILSDVDAEHREEVVKKRSANDNKKNEN